MDQLDIYSGRQSDPKCARHGGVAIGVVHGSHDRGCCENFKWLCGQLASSSLIDGSSTNSKDFDQSLMCRVQDIPCDGGNECSRWGQEPLSIAAWLKDYGIARVCQQSIQEVWLADEL